MKKSGFNLAEVLVVMVIIGVLAAMTIPVLNNSIHAHEFRSALKKGIAGVNQALKLQYALTGEIVQDFKDASTLVEKVFKKRMNLLEGYDNIIFTNTTACPASDKASTFISSDGIIFCIPSSVYSADDSAHKESSCNIYNTKPCIKNPNSPEPNLWIDVNGIKTPNTITTNAKRPKDIYQAMIYAQRIIPYGEPSQQILYNSGADESK